MSRAKSGSGVSPRQTATRMMGEAAAWRAVEKMFVGARHTTQRVRLDDFYVLAGLCSVIRHFGRAHRIDEATSERMIAAVDSRSTFKWAMNAAGHRHRAAFCRRMARLAAPKPKKSKPKSSRPAPDKRRKEAK